MGRLVDGKWSTEWYSADEEGRFQRDATAFHGKLGDEHPVEADRYHLYVSYACPWAHRTLILRSLKKLDHAISISVVDPFMGDDGWMFSDAPGAIPDSVNGAKFLREIYVKSKPNYTGRVTVPVLWDKKTGSIVNNESREIMRMFDKQMNAIAKSDVDLCPADLHDDIEREIDALYEPVNNGVYRSGFAESQKAYEEAVRELFDALDGYERRLAKQRYLLGDRLTEADICFFTTLVRFDPVYHYHFKCNLHRLRDYENIWAYTRDIHQTPGVSETVNLVHIKEHYFRSHPMINPTRIVPVGPVIDYDAPHGRDRM